MPQQRLLAIANLLFEHMLKIIVYAFLKKSKQLFCPNVRIDALRLQAIHVKSASCAGAAKASCRLARNEIVSGAQNYCSRFIFLNMLHW